MASTKKSLDPEYNAMRRRMSRLRVNCGKKASLEAEDLPSGGDDPGFKDLIKYWKKHGIPIAKDLMSDMADENVKVAVARGKGRRKSRELEDLHMCASTGKFNLEKLSIPEDDDQIKPRVSNATLQKRSEPMVSKARGGSLKTKSLSRGNLNGTPPGQTTHKRLARSISNYK